MISSQTAKSRRNDISMALCTNNW